MNYKWLDVFITLILTQRGFLSIDSKWFITNKKISDVKYKSFYDTNLHSTVPIASEWVSAMTKLMSRHCKWPINRNGI